MESLWLWETLCTSVLNTSVYVTYMYIEVILFRWTLQVGLLMLNSLESVALKITSIIIKLLWSFFAKTWTYDRDNTCRYWIPLQHLNGNIVILTDFLHYLHQKFLKMKTSSAANDENFIESTFPLQWSASHKNINLQIFTQLSHCIHQQYILHWIPVMDLFEVHYIVR